MRMKNRWDNTGNKAFYKEKSPSDKNGLLTETAFS